MLNWLRTAGFAEFGSAILVFITAAVIGHEAAIGMNASQWMAGGVSVLGSVGLAVMVHVWPAKPRAKALAPRRD